MLKKILVLFMISFTKFSAGSERDSDSCTLKEGSPGICLPYQECIPAQANAARGEPPQVCNFSGGLFTVCCKVETPETTRAPIITVTEPVETSTTIQDNTKSYKKCKEYEKSIFVEQPPLTPFDKPKIVSQCGFKSKELVVGGEDAKSKEFPHMALLGYQFEDKINWLCGGSLISEKFVLTAAHCTKPNLNPKLVQLGLTSLLDKNETGAVQEFNVVNIMRHPDYFKNLMKYNDISLVELHREVSFTPYVRPACLHTSDKLTNKKALASGWGVDGNYDEVQKLMKVTLSLVPQVKCNETYYRKQYKRHLPRGIDAQRQICAGDPGKDTCKGDSGGPLQIYRLDMECSYDIIGITSFGLECGLSPGVYTGIQHYLPWIENIVWP